MSAYPYQFEGRIERYAFETYAYTVIYLPSAFAARPPFKDQPRLRIVGEVAEHPVAGAWQPAGGGRRYFLLSKRFLKAADLSLGDLVEMRFRLDDPNAVTIPPSIAGALQRNKAFAKAWAALTPGAQRAFAHRVVSAKTAPTEQRRLGEVIEMVLTGVKPGAPSKARRAGKRTGG
jgi:hypothetical protein